MRVKFSVKEGVPYVFRIPNNRSNPEDQCNPIPFLQRIGHRLIAWIYINGLQIFDWRYNIIYETSIREAKKPECVYKCIRINLAHNWGIGCGHWCT